MDLLPLVVLERNDINGKIKDEMVKRLHESIHKHIENKNKEYASKVDKR